MDAALAGMDLSMSLWCALERIGAKPGMSTHALAELASMTDQSLSALVARLADRGLVERTQGSGRVILHRLTDLGARTMAVATPIVVDVLAKELAPLDAEELDTFVSLLHKVRDAQG